MGTDWLSEGGGYLSRWNQTQRDAGVSDSDIQAGRVIPNVIAVSPETGETVMAAGATWGRATEKIITENPSLRYGDLQTEAAKNYIMYGASGKPKYSLEETMGRGVVGPEPGFETGFQDIALSTSTTGPTGSAPTKSRGAAGAGAGGGGGDIGKIALLGVAAVVLLGAMKK